MNACWLRITLESDAAFGRGDGVPGLVDRDVMFDPNGCPYMNGRTLKGLLDEVCADLLYALGPRASRWKPAADSLFGVPGSTQDTQGIMRIGRAQLPLALRQAVHAEIAAGHWSREDVLNSLTTIRRQTAMEAGGAPDPETLRSTRLILRGTMFEAQVDFTRDLTDDEKGWLGACVKGLRRAGTARNRGHGRIHAQLEDENGQDLSETWYRNFFRKEVCP